MREGGKTDAVRRFQRFHVQCNKTPASPSSLASGPRTSHGVPSQCHLTKDASKQRIEQLLRYANGEGDIVVNRVWE